jgi:aldose 1-epimerase
MRIQGRRRGLRAGTGIGVVAMAALAAAGGIAAAKASAAPKASADHGKPSITKQFFGNAVEPYTGRTEPTYRYVLNNGRGMQVDLLSYGAITQQIWVPGRNGDPADVILGFKTLKDYVTQASPPVTANGGPYFGETIGRYGNRIALGKFSLKQPDGHVHNYTLQVNNGVNSLHGGLVGFGNHIWHQVGGLIDTPSEVGVTLQLVSPNGDGHGAKGSPGCPNGCTGYPAQLTVDVTFTLNSMGQYTFHYVAHNDSNLNTVVALTNHNYYNLAGESSGSAENQFIQINADTYTPTDATQIPLKNSAGDGIFTPVKGTPFDFTRPRTLGSGIEDCTQTTASCNQLLLAHGYDHNWVLNKQTRATTGPDGLNLAARAFDPWSGRMLTVWTDQPGVQFYSSNYLTGTLVGISGHIYRQTQAYTFETQHFPNSPNTPNFPTTELDAGQTLNTTTVLAFSS